MLSYGNKEERVIDLLWGHRSLSGWEGFWKEEEEKEDIPKIKQQDQKTETLSYVFRTRIWSLVSMGGHGDGR